MSTHINIENYESFYLDYLEGNLDEKDSAALFAFLEKNPELIIEEDALAYLPEAEFVGLDNQSKSALKFPDTEQKIGLNNIEIFLIASVEKQLSAEKSAELQVFLKANPFYAEELTLYQRSRLEADLSIVFPEKRSMKKGIIIPMYARFAAAAASVIIAISLLNLNEDKPTTIASTDKPGKTEIISKTTDPGKNSSTEEVQIIQVNPDADANSPVFTKQLAQNNPQEIPAVTPIIRENTVKLKTRPVKPVNTSRLLIHEPEQAFVFAPETAPMESSFAMVEMKNPIQPITKRISEVLNKDVDFKTSKAARKKSGGFYLKIGKFEVSRKVYDPTSIAVK